MDTRQNLIVDRKKQEVLTPRIQSCFWNSKIEKYEITFSGGNSYSYNSNRIEWRKNPTVCNPALYRIFHCGKELLRISAIYIFQGDSQNYWHICFENGSERDYLEQELVVQKSCLDDAVSKNVWEYFQQIAAVISLKGEDGTKLLMDQYEKVSGFVGTRTPLACYLNPDTYKPQNTKEAVPVFPFGCNASQYQAVKNALENQISVIQGPPGTGKTQTILNIIANLLIAGKTVQVVSNNNSATANVLEKLASPEYRLDFLVAALGNSDNKAAFLRKQTGQYPDLSEWIQEMPDPSQFFEEIRRQSMKLHSIFQQQEQLSLAKQEWDALKTERKHFAQYVKETGNDIASHKIRKKLSAQQFMDLWQECQNFSDRGTPLSFWFKIKSRFRYGISDWKFYRQDLAKIITLIQNLFYQTKSEELQAEILELEQNLKQQNAKKLAEEFQENSMQYLKGILYWRYGERPSRRIFSREDLWKSDSDFQKEYPIVLSTTHSSRSSLHTHTTFDYLIMDEASQVDIATGALALSSAKNAVIVGDIKQLPNVVTNDIEKRTDAIFDSFRIRPGYRFSQKSFLQSICEILPQVPQTLLREHYRCHPKIINFCNQKFYGGNLVIMSEDHGESDVLSVVKTAPGNHARGHMNQRQIDVVQQEILPKLHESPSQIGIIAPYNDQVRALKTALANTAIDIATVHKFQGREKDTMILTTVDNQISDFTDDPYLLNVAVSRAKKHLCLVVSGNEPSTNGNIQDLISYIAYHNCSVTESKIYSVFDYLYRQYTESRMEFLKKHRRISEYDSENLVYSLIQDTLQELNLPDMGVICHQPLNMLIHDPELLNDEECRYAMNSATHLDFLIYSRVSKKPVLAIEVDGFRYHQEGTRQAARDQMKNHILDLYGIPYLRFTTNGSGEKEELVQRLRELPSLI